MSDKMEHDMAVIARLIKDESDRVRDENKRLKYENEQLRELVVRMARALDIDVDWCVRGCYAEFRCKGSCAIADALVELGIAEYEEEDE